MYVRVDVWVCVLGSRKTDSNYGHVQAQKIKDEEKRARAWPPPIRRTGQK